jgi:hypothetical protein
MQSTIVKYVNANNRKDDSAMLIQVTLFDFTDPEKPKQPITSKLTYGSEAEPLEFGPKKLNITVGDLAMSATVNVPLNVLTQLMAQVMEADEKRNGGGIIMPPGLIVPKPN